MSTEPETKETHAQVAIWIGQDAAEGTEGFCREVHHDQPIGRPFEAAMKLMRDEGWDTITLIRTRQGNS